MVSLIQNLLLNFPLEQVHPSWNTYSAVSKSKNVWININLLAEMYFFYFNSQLKNTNLKNSSRAHVTCNHTLIKSDFIDLWDCSPRLQNDEDLDICSNYIVMNRLSDLNILT